MLRIKEVRGIDAVENLREEWQTLFSMTDASPFLSWEWISTWQRWFNSAQIPYILCAQSDNTLVGLLALGEEQRRLPLLSMRVRRLSFLGEDPGSADYLDVLSLPEYQSEAASVIFDHLMYNVTFDVLDLDSISAESPNLPLLIQKFGARRKFRHRLTPRFVCPQVKFESGWTDILKKSKRASNFKRRLQQLRKLEGFEYRTITHPEEVGDAFERFLKLHEARWTGKGGSDATGNAILKNFHRDVVKRWAHAGLLWFEELWAEGACRASIYGLNNKQRYYYYNSGYDQTWKSKSPGLVLLGLSLENAARRGIKIYDFLRGDETYKFDWATTTDKTADIQIFSQTLPASLFIAHKRAQTTAHVLIKALLPESAKGLLHRWKRSRKHRASKQPGYESHDHPCSDVFKRLPKANHEKSSLFPQTGILNNHSPVRLSKNHVPVESTLDFNEKRNR
ncbi:MAG: GNAT family N-acetyltransferase [Candidatus Brocadiaceae bacterium]|nr:GNAT family N-acetyltransferase [Candidatus Brocadiaceae bacterium]